MMNGGIEEASLPLRTFSAASSVHRAHDHFTLSHSLFTPRIFLPCGENADGSGEGEEREGERERRSSLLAVKELFEKSRGSERRKTTGTNTFHAIFNTAGRLFVGIFPILLRPLSSLRVSKRFMIKRVASMCCCGHSPKAA